MSYAEIIKPTYKAKTDAECVKERECVWYHLLLATQLSQINKATNVLNVKKWEKPVRIRLISPDKPRQKLFDSYISQLLLFFPQDLTENQKYNFLIMFTDNIERTLSVTFNDVFKALFGQNIAPTVYRQETEKDPNGAGKCYFFHMQDPSHNNTIYTYFAFIEPDHPNISLCMREVIYSGFGLSNDAKSPIWDAAKKTNKYSDTEQLLLFILQRQTIHSGMSYDELRQAFDSAYEPAMKFMEETGTLDDF